MEFLSKKKNTRRFSDEQIRCLELMFESETRLEPRKKVLVAKELGLQPRQVAIWFQNKRARWKSKHIEKEYAILMADYNNLTSKFESLKKEKQSLLIQMEKLKTVTMEKCQERGGNCSTSSRESDYSKNINGFDQVINSIGGGLFELDDQVVDWGNLDDTFQWWDFWS